MRLLWFNLAVDRADPVLGFAVRWIEAVAARVEHVDVVTMRLGDAGGLPANVEAVSVGKERGWSEPHRFVEFHRILRRIDAGGRPDAVFAHMMPLFVVLAARWARRRRIPQVLWYAHRATAPRVRLAARLADEVVTSTPGGYRLRTPPAVCLGQGIETDRFTSAGRDVGTGGRVLIAGRIAPAKRIEESIETVERAAALQPTVPWSVTIVGGPSTDEDRGYETRLRTRAARATIPVEWLGPVAHDRMPAVYAGHDLLVNLSDTGSLDKVLLESMASGCLPISSNESFRTEFADSPVGVLAVPAMAVPAMAVPAMAVPAMAVPAMAVPAMAVPATAVPATAAAAETLAAVAARDDLAAVRAAGRDLVVRNHGLDALADRIVDRLRRRVAPESGS